MQKDFFREIDVQSKTPRVNNRISYTMDKILKFGATIGAILILTSGFLPSIAFSIFLLLSIYYETGQSEMKNHPTKLKKTVQFNDEIDLRNYTLLEEEESELSMIENDAVMTKKIIRKFKNPPADFYYMPFFQAINQERDMRCGAVGGRDFFQYLQEKALHKYQFGVLQDFLEKYKMDPTFAFLWLQAYTHNDQNLVKLYDDDLSSFPIFQY